MKPIFQLIFVIIATLFLVAGTIMIPVSLITGTPSLMNALLFFGIGVMMTISMSTAMVLASLMEVFSLFLEKINDTLETPQHSSMPPTNITVRGISPDELEDMPDNHPLKRILSSIGVINSKQGKRNISEMTLDELKEELKAEEADEKQDFEKCIILRDEIARREKEGKS